MKILVVEDDVRIAKAIAEYLREQNYIVEIATDGEMAWELFEVYPYDLILLDIMLPKLDGFTICRRLRERGNTIPILMLTARDTIEDRVIGLDAGADDYLIKPFNLQELSARIRALLRRGSDLLPAVLEWGDVHLNTSTCEVFYKEQLIPLSPKEYQLLAFFMYHPNRLFSRSQLLEHVWSFDDIPLEGTIKVHIRSIRKKLTAVGCNNRIIETVYGLGYRLKEIA